MKKGFSLTEILSTIVILAVLAAIAIPGYSKTKQKNEERQAVTYLRAIRLAEKMHYAKNATYLACADDAAIRTNLGAEIKNGSYAFTVASSPPATTFTATATGTNTITVDQDGIFTKGGVVYSPS